MLGDQNLWRKTYAYDGSARIPFIVKPPEYMDLKRNLQNDSLVGLEDIMTTVLEAAGVPIPAMSPFRTSTSPRSAGPTAEWIMTSRMTQLPPVRSSGRLSSSVS